MTTETHPITVNVDGNEYYISSWDWIRLKAMQLDWNQDKIIGRVDVSGCGHYAIDTIDDPAIIAKVEAALLRKNYEERQNAVHYNSAVQFSVRYGAPIL